MEQSYNLRSPAVKRLMREAQELHNPTSDYGAKPLDDNLFEWHFTFRGPADTDFEGGYYHGRIILPPEYPMKPPSIMLLNPNGRFELHKKICLSISGYHPESWQPSWSIRTAILAIIAFMPSKGEGAIGALDYTSEERKILAKKSRLYSCPSCGKISELLSTNCGHVLGEDKTDAKDRELAKQILFTKSKESAKTTDSSKGQTTCSSVPATSSEGTTTAASTSTSDDNGLKQRKTTSTSPEQSSSSTTSTPQRSSTNYAQTQNRVTSKGDTASLVIIIVLVVAIALLMLRRFDKIYDFTTAF